MELDALRDPQRLAVAAKELGMVPPSQPAFIRLGDGRVLGTRRRPPPATRVRINPLPTPKPAALKQRDPSSIKVPATDDRRVRRPTPAAPPRLRRAKAIGRRPTHPAADSGATH